MPHGEVHKQKSKKNWAVFGIVIGLMAIIWGVTMVKITTTLPDGEQKLTPLVEAGVETGAE